MSSFGSSILTNLGQAALTAATVSNPIQIQSFTFSNTTSDLDPNTTSMSGWITKTVTGIVLIDTNTVEISCVVEPYESIDVCASVGVYLSDETLFMISNPSSPIPPGMRQVVKTQISYSNASSYIDFNIIPWDFENQNLMIVNNQVSVLNSMNQLQSKNQVYDAMKYDYYAFTGSMNNYRSVYLNSVTGNDSLMYGTDYTLPLQTIDYAIDKNRPFKFTKYLLQNSLYYNIQRSHDLYNNNIVFKPFSGDYGVNFSNKNWFVVNKIFKTYNDASYYIQNIDDFYTGFKSPSFQTMNDFNEDLLTVQTGLVDPGYWIAILPINNSTVMNLSLDLYYLDAMQIFVANGVSIYTSPNFYSGSIYSSNGTSGLPTNLEYTNVNISIPPYTRYLYFLIWNANLSPTGFYVNDNSIINTTGSCSIKIVTNYSNGILYPPINSLNLYGDCDITFENLFIDLSDVNNFPYNENCSFINVQPGSNSNVNFSSCNIILGNNIVIADMLNSTLSKLDVSFIDCDIIGNSNTSLVSQYANIDIALQTEINNVNTTLQTVLNSEPYDIGIYAFGPYISSQIITQTLVVRNIVIPSDFVGSSIYAEIAPTNNATLTISVNSSSIGTATFASGSNTGTFIQNGSGNIIISSGSILDITTPFTPDPTLANISTTIKATTAV